MKILRRDNPEKKISDETLDILKPYMVQFGDHELAYSLLQRGMEYFILEDVGVVGFRSIGRKPLVLGDPLADKKDYERIMSVFFDNFKNASFIQAHKDFSTCLHDNHGFYANEMGVSTELSIPHYNLVGEAKQKIRTGINKAKKEGVTIREVSLDNLKGLEFLVDEYISTKTVKNEISFLAREFLTEDEWEVRKFVAEKDGRVVGLAVYSPMFSDGRIIGYLSDILRTSPEAPPGLSYAMNMHALRTFKEDREKSQEAKVSGGETTKYTHLSKFSLGLSPFANIKDEDNTNNPLTTLILTGMHEFGNSLYNTKGLARNKYYYYGEEQPTFYCSKSKLCVVDLLSVYKACNISVAKQVTGAFTR